MFWLILRLRYRLVLAAAHNRTGGNITLLTGLILGGCISLLLLMAAFFAAGLSVEFGGREAVARWILSGLLLNALITTLATGQGLQAGFSAFLSRPYPFSRRRLFWARHVIGLLDPLWLMYGITVAGLVAGYASSGILSALLPAGAGLLYVGFSYLAVRIAVGVVDRLLGWRFGTAFLYGVVLVAFALAPLAIVSAARQPEGTLLRLGDRILQILPPGLAASVITGSPGLRTLELLAWLVLAGALLLRVERLPVAGAVTRIASGWAWLLDKVAAGFGSEIAPLVTKALLYDMRCSRVRLNFVLTIPMTVLLPVLMGRSGGADAVYALHVALFFLSAAMATNIVMLNQFGFDGYGIERYLLLPVPVGRVLRAGSYASMLVGCGVVLACFIAWVACSSLGMVNGSAWIVVLLGLSGLFVFNAIGLWTSLLAPRPVPFDGIAGTQLSWQAWLVQGCAIISALGMAFIAVAPPVWAGLSGAWWLAPSLMCVATAAYLFSLSSASKLITVLRHELRCRIRIPE